MRMLGLMCMALSVVLLVDEAMAQNIWTIDKKGRKFRTVFDPENRIYLGTGYFGSYAGAWQNRHLFDFGIRIRHYIDIDENEVWKFRHYIMELSVLPTAFHHVPRIELTLYRGSYTRWAHEGLLVIPLSPPKKIHLPFNIGSEAILGKLTVESLSNQSRFDIGAIGGTVVFDFWRKKAFDSSIIFGLGPYYGLDILRQKNGTSKTTADVEHFVAPFTWGFFQFHFETPDGLHYLDFRADGYYGWYHRLGWRPKADISLSYEIIPLAINDLPVTPFLKTRYTYDIKSIYGHHAFLVTTGIQLGIPLE